MDSKRSDVEDTTPPAKSPSAGAKESSSNPARRRRDRREDPPAEDKVSSPKNSEAMMTSEPQRARRRRQQEGGAEGGGGGGWMSLDSDNSSSKNKKLSMMSMEDEDPDAREELIVATNKDKHFQEGDGEVLIIPDLDEEAGVDVDQRIAHAPRNVLRKIPTLAELEEEVAGSIPAQEEGINLQILSNTLVPASLLYEADTVWTFESLLREVQEELSELPKPKEKSLSQTTAANNTNAKSNNTTKQSKKAGQ